MAKQGFMGKVKGTIGDVTFYRGKKNGGKGADLVKGKGGVDRKTILNSPNFARTRENMSEFAASGLAAKGLVNVTDAVISGCKDSQFQGRLTKAFRTNISKDVTNERGSRVLQLDLLVEDLKGLQTNNKKGFNSTYFGKVTSSAIAAGTAPEVTVEAVVPMYDVSQPANATHYKLQVAHASATDTDGINWERGIAESDFISVTAGLQATTIVPSPLVSGGISDVIFVAIKYYQEVNGTKVAFNNKSYNSAFVLEVA